MATNPIQHPRKPHRVLNTVLKKTLTFVTYLLLKVLKTIGLSFAYTINAFFFTLMFVLLDMPSLLFSFLSSSKETARECEDCIWSGGEAGCIDPMCGGREVERMEVSGLKGLEKTNGLEGRYRMRICGTDEISELDLDGDRERGDEGGVSEDGGMAGERHRQRLVRVMDWAARLEAERGDGAGAGEEVVGDGGYFSLPVGAKDRDWKVCSAEDA